MAGAEEGRGESEERSLEQHDTFPSTGRRLGGGGDEGLSCWVWGEEGVGCDDPLSFKHTGTHFAQKHTHTPLLQADVTTAQGFDKQGFDKHSIIIKVHHPASTHIGCHSVFNGRVCNVSFGFICFHLLN